MVLNGAKSTVEMVQAVVISMATMKSKGLFFVGKQLFQTFLGFIFQKIHFVIVNIQRNAISCIPKNHSL